MLKRFAVVVLIVVGTGVYQPLVRANLGEPVAAARARARDYSRRYGAIDPIFRTDPKGVVVMECWAAPPEMWTKSVVQRFATELLPAALQKESPKAVPKDGFGEAFIFPDGTILALQESRGRYIGVEVRAASYDGPAC